MNYFLVRTLILHLRCWSIAAAVLLLIMRVPALAQQKPSQTATSEQPSTARVATPDKPATLSRPAISQEQALYLVRSTLLTLNDANRSGNYTVLRDLAAPDFQVRNSSADLAQSFADLRRRNFDLFATALIAPQFTAEPAFDAGGKLRMAGYFATRPLRINFDLTFQNVNGQWRLFAVSVATPEAPAVQSQLTRPPVPHHAAGPYYGYRILSGIVGVRW
jgi:hypothetical protein